MLRIVVIILRNDRLIWLIVNLVQKIDSKPTGASAEHLSFYLLLNGNYGNTNSDLNIMRFVANARNPVSSPSLMLEIDPWPVTARVNSAVV